MYMKHVSTPQDSPHSTLHPDPLLLTVAIYYELLQLHKLVTHFSITSFRFIFLSLFYETNGLSMNKRFLFNSSYSVCRRLFVLEGDHSFKSTDQGLNLALPGFNEFTCRFFNHIIKQTLSILPLHILMSQNNFL
jgi:hypothetical protein